MTDLQEQLRQCHERHLETALKHRTDGIVLSRMRGRIKWWVFLALGMVLTDMLAPVRSILWHPTSWAVRVSELGLMPGMLLGWMAAGCVLLLPYLLYALFRPTVSWRRAAIGMAATGAGMGAFGFGVMAFMVSRFDAPQAASQWAISAAWCVFVMLMLTSAVNNEQNVKRACEEGAPCV